MLANRVKPLPHIEGRHVHQRRITRDERCTWKEGGDSRIFDDTRSGFVEHALGPVLFAADARGGPALALYDMQGMSCCAFLEPSTAQPYRLFQFSTGNALRLAAAAAAANQGGASIGARVSRGSSK